MLGCYSVAWKPQLSFFAKMKTRTANLAVHWTASVLRTAAASDLECYRLKQR